jgi:hypothetical protein
MKGVSQMNSISLRIVFLAVVFYQTPVFAEKPSLISLSSGSLNTSHLQPPAPDSLPIENSDDFGEEIVRNLELLYKETIRTPPR